jgi:hypothetical protein
VRHNVVVNGCLWFVVVVVGCCCCELKSENGHVGPVNGSSFMRAMHCDVSRLHYKVARLWRLHDK